MSGEDSYITVFVHNLQTQWELPFYKYNKIILKSVGKLNSQQENNKQTSKFQKKVEIKPQALTHHKPL